MSAVKATVRPKRTEHKTNALMIAGGSTLDAEDCELLLRALDALDRVLQAELANKQDAAAGNTRSRILIVRAKVCAMESIRTEQREAADRREQIKDGIQEALGRLHKTNALLIATQFSANHECEFDVGDAIAAIIERVKQHIQALDRLCLEASR
jgi:hypothetical protein